MGLAMKQVPALTLNRRGRRVACPQRRSRSRLVPVRVRAGCMPP